MSSRAAFGEIRFNRRLMARTAAGMYGAAAFNGVLELVLPHDPTFTLVPVVVVLVVFVGLLLAGHRLPRPALWALGPLGVGLCAYALASTPSVNDVAVLYALPVLYQTVFFGRRGALTILGLVAVGDALALHSLPGAIGYPERWVDVMVSVVPIALVVLALEARNEGLLRRASDEARTDPLTGLNNRRGFDERAAAELARLRRAPGPCAVVSFDIDFFKRVNDRWGHDVGDRVLCHLASLLRAHARDVDVLARFGGEEFVALLPGADALGAGQFAERVRAALASAPGALPPVRVSAGVAASAATIDLDALQRAADAALYAAKRAGRDRIVHAGPAPSAAPVGLVPA